MRNIVCFCEHNFEIDIPDIIDMEKDENIINSILAGEFMNIKCPNCKTLLKPELPLRLIDNSKKIDIYFIPEIDRTSFLMNKLPYDINTPERIVIGYKELVEKITILQNGLNDQAIEIIKYYILSKAREKAMGDDIRIFFHKQENDTFFFYIEGLKKDEIGQYEIKNDLYQKVQQDVVNKLSDPSFSVFLQPPYVSLNKVYME